MFILSKLKGKAYITDCPSKANEVYESNKKVVTMYSKREGVTVPLKTRLHKDKLLSQAGSWDHLQKHQVYEWKHKENNKEVENDC